ncbi:unnamed protein product [Rotaria magnacalcarata]|uniref:Uncharacterized protein n=2 Tax=Rotaria magnacalcarata TaxID=392030 RepID=A0A816UL43_9BILA|nr:unnamed protein product [Rotaria magnacalcarata]CAF3747778.1 unnamed protein product [Rotaria magnacalcarata]
MANHYGHQINNGYNYPSNAGNNYCTRYQRPNRGSRPSNYSSFNTNNSSRQQQQHIFPKRNNTAASSQKAGDGEFNAYAVNLLLKPVEMGIIGKINQNDQVFNGLGAFNRYFGLLAPSKNLGYTLPDVWDGYFHITLAEFSTHLEPHQLEDDFSNFYPCLENLPYIPDVVFRASTIKSCSGDHRTEDRCNIDFLVLPIDAYIETKEFFERVQPLLAKIKTRTKSYRWHVTPLDNLHVTIRKYSEIQFELNEIKIAEFPLEFRCYDLEVKQTRKRATQRFEEARRDGYRWWTGVTEIDGKCSGCQKSTMFYVWEGFCLFCQKYESMIPIWSTDGKHIKSCQQIKNEENVKQP